MEGNPVAGTMKNVLRGVAVATVPLTMGFPKAIFCYWVTSNLFSLVYGLVVKSPGVKKFLGIPEIPKAPPAAVHSFAAPKRATSVMQEPTSIPDEPVEPLKHSDRKICSTSVLSQRIRSLEKQVKGRKKSKKS